MLLGDMISAQNGKAWSWWGLYLENIGDAQGAVYMTATGTPPDVTMEYSLDGGRTWVEWGVIADTSDLDPVSVAPGERICFRAGNNGNVRFSNSPSAYRRFVISFDAAVGGNVLSLLSQTKISEFPIRTSAATYAFNSLFRGNSTLLDASELILSASALVNYAYYQMFFGCYRMTVAPVLPATTLGGNCYESMFYNCYGMLTAPELPATTLASACYARMFYGCSALTIAPTLPTASIQYCFYYMFYGCTKITSAPVLTATTVPSHGYDSMFSGCRSLTYVKTSQTTFDNCPSWLNNVSSSGTFECPAALGTNATITRGASACPSGWTVVNT